MSHFRKAGWAALVLILALGTGACGGDGGSGPGDADLADPAALESELDAVGSTFDNDVFESLAAVDLALDFEALPAPGMAGVGALAKAMRPLRSKADASRPAMLSRAAALRRAFAASGASRVPVIPDYALGVTYEWDETNDRYADLGRSGAPANGVRVILYAVDPLDGLPVEPVTEVGHIDIIDQGSGATASLRVTVVGDDDVTYADYDLTATSDASGGTASASGYVGNGSRRIDFDLDASASEAAGTVRFDVDVEVDDPDVGFDLSFAFDFSDLDAITNTVSFSFRRGGETVSVSGVTTHRYDGVNLTTDVDYTVRVNGAVYATITGSLGDLTIAGADGEALTPEELAALGRLFDAPGEILEAFGEFLDPGFGLFGFDPATATP